MCASKFFFFFALSFDFFVLRRGGRKDYLSLPLLSGKHRRKPLAIAEAPTSVTPHPDNTNRSSVSFLDSASPMDLTPFYFVRTKKKKRKDLEIARESIVFLLTVLNWGPDGGREGANNDQKKKQNSFLFGEEAIIELNFRVTHFSFFLKIFLRGL